MVKSLGLNINAYVVIGGGVLEVLDLRQTVDVDLVVSKSVYGKFKDLGWKEYIRDLPCHHRGKPLPEIGVTALRVVVFHGDGKGLFRADEHDQPFAPGDAGI